MMLAEVKAPSFTIDATGLVGFAAQVAFLTPGQIRVTGEIFVSIVGGDTQAAIAAKVTAAVDAQATALGILAPSAVVMPAMNRIR